MDVRHGNSLGTWTGVLAVVLGLLLAAEFGVLGGTHFAIGPQTTEQWSKSWRCPADELAEENVSLAECQSMAARVGAIIAARPAWFRPAQIALGSVGVIAALVSVIVAIGMVDRRRWAARAAVFSFSVLLGLDALQIAMAAQTGPVLRSESLWKFVPWGVVHLALLTAVLAGMQAFVAPAKRGPLSQAWGGIQARQASPPRKIPKDTASRQLLFTR